MICLLWLAVLLPSKLTMVSVSTENPLMAFFSFYIHESGRGDEGKRGKGKKGKGKGNLGILVRVENVGANNHQQELPVVAGSLGNHRPFQSPPKLGEVHRLDVHQVDLSARHNKPNEASVIGAHSDHAGLQAIGKELVRRPDDPH